MSIPPPNIPALSSKVDNEVRRALDAIKGWLTKASSAGMVTRATLVQDLSDNDGTNGLVKFFGGTIPPRILHLTVVGGFDKIMLMWDDPRYLSLDYIEVWRHTEDDLGGAQNIGQTISNIYSDTPPDSSIAMTYYYWVRIISKAGIAGPFNLTEGTPGNTASDPTYVLELLNGAITSSELYRDLNDAIGAIAILSGEDFAKTLENADGLAGKALNALAKAEERAANILAHAEELAAQALNSSVLDRLIGEADLSHSLTQVGVMRANITEELARGAGFAREAEDRARAILDEQDARGIAIAAEAIERELLASRVLGADGTSNTSGIIYNERYTRSNALQSMALQMSLLSAGVEGGFDPYQTYYFDTTSEGWTGDGCVVLQSGGWVDQVSVSASPAMLIKTGIGIIGSKYATVKFRIKRLSGSGWGLSVDYQTVNGWIIGKNVTPATVVVGDAATLTVDFSDTIAWTGGTVTGIRIKSGETIADRFSFDWIAIGRQAPAVSVASFFEEQEVRAEADRNQVTAREVLSSKLVGQNDPTGLTIDTITSGLIYEEKTARSTIDAAHAGRLNTLEATVNHIDTGVAATASALDSVTLDVYDSETGLVAVGERVQTLESALTNPDSGTLATIHLIQETTANLESAFTKESRTTMSTFNANGEGLLSQIVAGARDKDATAAYILEEQHTRATALLAEAVKRIELASRVGETEAAIIAEQATRADAVSAEASERVKLAARVTGTEAAINSEQLVRAELSGSFTDETRTSVSTFNGLGDALLTGIIAGETERKANSAFIVTEQKTRATALEAAAERVDTIAARVETAETAIITEQQARATAIEAEAVKTELLLSRVGENAAAISTEQEARVSAQRAEAIQRNLLAVRLFDNEAAISDERAVRAELSGSFTDETRTSASAFNGLGDALLTGIIAGETERKANSAFIVTEQKTRATALEAAAERVDTIAARVETAETAIITEQQARATAIEAEAVKTELLLARVGENAAAISTEQEARVDAQRAEAIQRNLLAVRLFDNEAAISDEREARADAEGAFTEESHTSVSVFGLVGDALLTGIVAGETARQTSSAFIVEEQKTRATAIEAEAVKSEVLSARLGLAEAEIIAERKVRSDALSAEAESRELLAARLGQNEAAIVEEQSARVDALRAEAIQRNLLTARLGSNEASLLVEQEVRASSIAPMFSEVTAYNTGNHVTHGSPIKLYKRTGASITAGTWDPAGWTEVGADLYASYTIRTDVNGHIAGAGIANDGETSRFIVNADQFAVTRPVKFTGDSIPSGAVEENEWADSNGIVKKYIGGTWVKQKGHAVPIAVLTSEQEINGVTLDPGVYIDGASIVHLTADSAVIRGLSVDSLVAHENTFFDLVAQNLGVTNAYIGDSIESGTSSITPEGGRQFNSTFVQGSEGWKINREGDCEFNGGTFRGAVVFSSSPKNAAGQPIEVDNAAAAADATAKANAAQSAAQTYAAAQAEAARVTAQAYADGEVTAEETRAISDATAKAEAARVAAVNTAAADATAKANAAQSAAQTYAAAQAEAARVTAQAYADGEVTAEETRAISDATAKAEAARVAAVNAAAADATAKANAVAAGAAPAVSMAANIWTRPGQTTIDGAKISTGDLGVDTLQIKGNAVTVPICKSYTEQTNFNSLGAYVASGSITLNQPGTILILYTGLYNAYGSDAAGYGLYKNGSLLLDTGYAHGQTRLHSFSWSEDVSAGYHGYDVLAYSNGSALSNTTKRTLSLIGAMR